MKKIIFAGLMAVVLSACGRAPENGGRVYEQYEGTGEEAKIISEATNFERFRLLEIEGKNLNCISLVELKERNDRYSNVFEFEFANKYTFSQCREQIEVTRANFCKQLIEDDIFKTIDRQKPEHYRNRSYGRTFEPELHSEICKSEIQSKLAEFEEKGFEDTFLEGSFIKIHKNNTLVNAKYITKIDMPYGSVIAPFYLVNFYTTDNKVYLSAQSSEEKAFEFISRISKAAK